MSGAVTRAGRRAAGLRSPRGHPDARGVRPAPAAGRRLVAAASRPTSGCRPSCSCTAASGASGTTCRSRTPSPPTSPSAASWSGTSTTGPRASPGRRRSPTSPRPTTTCARRARVDLARTAVVGHSAGGHLALWLASRARLPGRSARARARRVPPPALVVAQAPVADLARGGAAAASARGAVAALLGGEPAEVPDRLAVGRPARRCCRPACRRCACTARATTTCRSPRARRTSRAPAAPPGSCGCRAGTWSTSTRRSARARAAGALRAAAR